MVASRQVEIQFYRLIGQHCRLAFGALAHVIGRTAIPFLCKHTVPAAKRVGGELLKFAAAEFAEVVSCKKSFKTAAECVGRQILRKKLSSGSRKRTASRVVPTKSKKQTSRSRRDIFTIVSQ